MANEAVVIELAGQPKGKPMRFRVGDAAAIEKNALLWYYDAAGQKRASGAAVTHAAKPFAGIASTEKKANDGTLNLGLYRCGVFDLTTDGGADIKTGEPVIMSGANLICRMPVAEPAGSGAYIVGYALEDASANETIQVAVGW